MEVIRTLSLYQQGVANYPGYEEEAKLMAYFSSTSLPPSSPAATPCQEVRYLRKINTVTLVLNLASPIGLVLSQRKNKLTNR